PSALPVRIEIRVIRGRFESDQVRLACKHAKSVTHFIPRETPGSREIRPGKPLARSDIAVKMHHEFILGGMNALQRAVSGCGPPPPRAFERRVPSQHGP